MTKRIATLNAGPLYAAHRSHQRFRGCEGFAAAAGFAGGADASIDAFRRGCDTSARPRQSTIIQSLGDLQALAITPHTVPYHVVAQSLKIPHWGTP